MNARITFIYTRDRVAAADERDKTKCKETNGKKNDDGFFLFEPTTVTNKYSPALQDRARHNS